jgi:polygalacturonase
MQSQILREVHVDDYGAVPDGETDSTEAFKKALGNGNVKVHMSAGTYRVNGIQMPSNSILIGQGIGVTNIKLLDDAPVDSYRCDQCRPCER